MENPTPEQIKALIEQARKAGIKEVVDFLKTHKFLMIHEDYLEWQSKLEEWGL